MTITPTYGWRFTAAPHHSGCDHRHSRPDLAARCAEQYRRSQNYQTFFTEVYDRLTGDTVDHRS